LADIEGTQDRGEDGERVVAYVEDADVQVRDAARREIDVRLLPWDTVIETRSGPEEFRRGAFAGVSPDGLYLMPMEHEVGFGLGQVGQMRPIRKPAGRSFRVWEADDGPYASFKVGRTQAGDEMLALAEDRIIRGVSVEFREVPGGTHTETRAGRRVRVHTRVDADAASLTYHPAYGERAEVVAVRSHEEAAPMGETVAPNGADTTTAVVPASAPEAAWDAFFDRLAETQARSSEREDKYLARLENLEERARASFAMPGEPKPVEETPGVGIWMETVLKLLTGERITNDRMRALDDLITTDNAGVVPPTYGSEIIGIIDPARPFLASTRRIETPSTGMSLILPRIVTRPTVATQATQKTDIDSTATSIDTQTYNAITKAGGGDISLQLLKRSSPSFLSLYLELLFEAYAIESDDEAVDVLLAASLSNGGTLDPEDASFGSAWSNAIGVSRRLAPDTIWMSSTAVAAFIDAKASTTNQPLYSNIAANFTAGGGEGGTISALRPVHVPALDDEAVDVIVGPSRGFLWAEDGTYTLQVDVPAKAGRDVAVVGMLWFAPIYPTAFTKYVLAS